MYIRINDKPIFIRIVKSNKCYKYILTFFIALLIIIFLLSSCFLLYDHLTYTNKVPPSNIQIWRDISSIIVLVFMGLFTIGMSYLFWKERQYLILVVLGLYFFSGIFWGFYHFYYTIHQHKPSDTISILHLCSIIYSITITILVLVYACWQNPELCLVFCLCSE